MKNSNTNQTNIDADIFSTELDEIPGTDALQAKILQKTQGMQQTLNEPIEVQDNITSLASFTKKKYFAPFALAASVALMAILWMPTNTPESNITSVQSVDESLDDEWAFEEAMLFEDELMFANL